MFRASWNYRKLLALNFHQLCDWPHHAVSNQWISCILFDFLLRSRLPGNNNRQSNARNIDELGDIMAKAAVVFGFLSSQIETWPNFRPKLVRFNAFCAENVREWSISSLVVIIPATLSNPPFPTFRTSKQCRLGKIVEIYRSSSGFRGIEH